MRLALPCNEDHLSLRPHVPHKVVTHVILCLVIHFCITTKMNLTKAPEVKGENPLNLSISVSGGEEINKDCLSRGD
jgi:hypothetical protein